jgi:hypothetical protein
MIIICLILTLLFGSIVNSLVEDFVFTIKIDKKMFMQVLNAFVFVWLLDGFEKSNNHFKNNILHNNSTSIVN